MQTFLEANLSVREALRVTGYSKNTFYKYVKVLGIKRTAHGYYAKEDILTMREKAMLVSEK